jgi:cell division protein FtsL
MNARTLAIGMVTGLYTLVVVAAYAVVTSTLNTKLPLLLERKHVFDEIETLQK